MEREKAYTDSELEAPLKGCFVDKKANFVLVDGHTLKNRFLTESIQYGLDKGLLVRGDDIDEDENSG